MSAKSEVMKAKTLIVHGKHDPMIHVKNALTINRLIPHSHLEIISQMRHLIEPEIFVLFDQRLLEHLEQNI